MPSLNWIGKDKVINHHLEVPYRLLKKGYSFGEAGSQNKIIRGDNLEALKALLPEYEGKIKCIYIDPPYNTGNEGWIYNDNVSDPKLKKWLGEVVGKEGDDLTRHDKWLCMMYPRLKLLNRLLADDGAIFVSLDDNEEASLKLIMDEIFGVGNFIANIAVVNNFKGRSDDKFIATAHESLLVFQKGNFITNGVPVPEEYVEEYKLKDDIGFYRLQGLRKRGSGSKREDRPNMYYPFYFNKNSKRLSLIKENEDDIEIFPKLSDGSDGRWRWGRETAIDRISELSSGLVKGRNEFDIFQKDYLQKEGQNKRIKPKSFWHGSEFSSEAGTLQLKKIFGEKSFPTPKSVDLVEYCLNQAVDKNSIILDSFAGSGTTGHAVLNLNKLDGGNRKFILVEMEEYADSITAERVKRVINGYGDIEGTDGGFDFYDLGPALLNTDGLLDDTASEDEIRAYICYTETALPLPTTKLVNHQYWLTRTEDRDHYFYYERESMTILDRTFLSTINEKMPYYTIWADQCHLSENVMKKHGITFRKIPRDIRNI